MSIELCLHHKNKYKKWTVQTLPILCLINKNRENENN